jgi:hypothetical protein
MKTVKEVAYSLVLVICWIYDDWKGRIELIKVMHSNNIKNQYRSSI